MRTCVIRWVLLKFNMLLEKDIELTNASCFRVILFIFCSCDVFWDLRKCAINTYDVMHFMQACPQVLQGKTGMA